MSGGNPAINYRIEQFPSRRPGERWSVLDGSGKPIFHGSALQCEQFKNLMVRNGYGDASPAKKGAAA